VVGRFLEENMGAMFPYFRVEPTLAVISFSLAIAISVLAAVIPRASQRASTWWTRSAEWPEEKHHDPHQLQCTQSVRAQDTSLPRLWHRARGVRDGSSANAVRRIRKTMNSAASRQRLRAAPGFRHEIASSIENPARESDPRRRREARLRRGSMAVGEVVVVWRSTRSARRPSLGSGGAWRAGQRVPGAPRGRTSSLAAPRKPGTDEVVVGKGRGRALQGREIGSRFDLKKNRPSACGRVRSRRFVVRVGSVVRRRLHCAPRSARRPGLVDDCALDLGQRVRRVQGHDRERQTARPRGVPRETVYYAKAIHGTAIFISAIAS